jgi:hypothetical protein
VRLPSTPARAIKPENIQCSFARRRPTVHYGQANATLHGQYLQQQAGALAAGGTPTGATSALMSAIRGGGATGGTSMSMGGNMPMNTMSGQPGLPSSGGGSASKLSGQAARNRTTPLKSSLPGAADDDRASMMSGGSDGASIDASDAGSALLHHSTGYVKHFRLQLIESGCAVANAFTPVRSVTNDIRRTRDCGIT